MCEKEVEENPWQLCDVPDSLKMQGMCNGAVQKIPLLLAFVPDHLQM